jgi:tRNA 2-thiouridine synthesizing protein E
MTTQSNIDILETVGFDNEGFMLDANAWTPEIGTEIASVLELTLTNRHWTVINFSREVFKAEGDAPTLRRITKETDVTTKELYQLFPGGAAKIAAKVGGLPKPTGCI